MISLEKFLPYYMVAAAVLLLANVVWAYRDARERGSSGVLIALLVLLVPFPLGVVLWVCFRPALRPDLESEEVKSEAAIQDEERIDAELKRRANRGLL